jgi:hypothetical protein
MHMQSRRSRPGGDLQRPLARSQPLDALSGHGCGVAALLSDR